MAKAIVAPYTKTRVNLATRIKGVIDHAVEQVEQGDQRWLVALELDRNAIANNLGRAKTKGGAVRSFFRNVIRDMPT